MDSAFFSDAIITSLDAQGVEYMVNVPFERFLELKERFEARRWWQDRGGMRLPFDRTGFEARWKPKAWNVRYRFLFIRTRVRFLVSPPCKLPLDFLSFDAWGAGARLPNPTGLRQTVALIPGCSPPSFEYQE